MIGSRGRVLGCKSWGRCTLRLQCSSDRGRQGLCDLRCYTGRAPGDVWVLACGLGSREAAV